TGEAEAEPERFGGARRRLLQHFFGSAQIVLAPLQPRQLDRGAQARWKPLQCFFQALAGVIDLAQTPLRQCQSISGFDIVWRRHQNGLQPGNRIMQDVLVWLVVMSSASFNCAPACFGFSSVACRSAAMPFAPLPVSRY